MGTTDNVSGLNALRFFGALLVILHHLGSHDWFVQLELVKWFRLFSGVTGVNIFYVISGFLITCLALDEIIKKGRFDFAKFLGRRALRLFPLYYLAVFTIAALAALEITQAEPEAFVYAITYAYNLVPKDFYNGLLGSFHTLATEEQFLYFVRSAVMVVSQISALEINQLHVDHHGDHSFDRRLSLGAVSRRLGRRISPTIQTS